MFDIGWQELFLVALVTIIVVGPKEIPRVLRTVTLWIRKVRSMAREFQDGIDDLAREADLDDLRQEITKTGNVDLDGEIGRSIDPSGEMQDTVREIGGALEDAKNTVNEESTAKGSGERATDASPKAVGSKTESAG